MEPERIGLFYSVRVVNPHTGKHYTPRWKMMEAAAAKYFEDDEYEILWGTKEERRVGGEMAPRSFSHLHTETPGRKG